MIFFKDFGNMLKNFLASKGIGILIAILPMLSEPGKETESKKSSKTVVSVLPIVTNKVLTLFKFPAFKSKFSIANDFVFEDSFAGIEFLMYLLNAVIKSLDEVDAALDLSHTQNIGHLIKTKFKGSQFIVVSLKEGMFTNANRVFRTRFQDGTSTVNIMT